ncbi:MAG: hypothetical protein ABI895_08000 [Deltaproteobacteria bacterium]
MSFEVPSRVLLLLVLACGAASTQPIRRPPGMLDFIVVPRPPPVVPVEIQPRQPVEAAVWIDGQWSWSGGDRWIWKHGGWAMLPSGATLSTWAYGYQADGRVRFWPATWLDAQGNPMPDPKIWVRAEGRAGLR